MRITISSLFLFLSTACLGQQSLSKSDTSLTFLSDSIINWHYQIRKPVISTEGGSSNREYSDRRDLLIMDTIPMILITVRFSGSKEAIPVALNGYEVRTNVTESGPGSWRVYIDHIGWLDGNNKPLHKDELVIFSIKPEYLEE